MIAKSVVLAALAAGPLWPQLLTVSCTPASLPVLVGTAVQVTCRALGGISPYTWSISPAGSLPTGLSQNSNTGAITGAIQNPGPYSFTVVATDSTPIVPLTGSQQYNGTAVGPLTVNCTLATGPLEVGVGYSDACTASGGTPPYSWAISGTTVPPGLTISPTGTTATVKDTPAAPLVDYQYNVGVTDSSGPPALTASQPFTGTIAPAVTIGTPTTLPAADAGSSYSQQFAVSTGTGVAPFAWTATGLTGTGLSMSATGLLSGIPTTVGPLSFTVTVTDSAGGTSNGKFSLTVNPALTITTKSPLPPASVNTPYSDTFAASGGTPPYSWTATGLPTWLTLTTAGVLMGTAPSSPGTATFPVTVTDSAGVMQTGSFSLTVNISQLTITTSGLANGAIGDTYNQALTGTGGLPPYSWSLAPGSPPLPTNLTLNPSTGVITGQPSQAGQFQFTIQLTDSVTPTPDTTTKAFTITIANLLTISTPPTLPNATVNTAYSQTLTAAGGVPPYTWSPAGPLPAPLAGLSLSAAGAITGTPSTSGTGSFTATVTDSAGGTNKQTFTLTVVFVITTPSPLPTGEVNVAYKQTFTATGGASPYTWSVTGGTLLPPGLTLAPTGVLSGTPITAGTYNFTVQATDQNNISVSAPLALTVVAVVSITTPATLAGGSLNAGYSQALAATGGVTPYTWTVTAGSLPNGLTLSPAGLISGVPTAVGTFAFTGTVTDSLGATASRQFTIVVANGLTITSPPTLPGATISVPYSYSLQASGGTAPYTWTNPTGLPPAGLTLRANGNLTGIPTTAGTSSFSVQVTDSLGHQATAQVSITVASALSITTSALPGASLGGAYSQTLAATGGTPPYTWSLLSGTLPGGLGLSSTGSIAGTANAAGTFAFTIEVTDSTAATATKPFSITVAGGGLTITTAATLPNASLTASYSQALAAVGGTPPYTWALTAGALPKGLTLSSAGAITGTPTAAGTFQFTATVTDSASNTANQQFTLTVGGLAITTTALPGGKVGTPYSQAFTASGGSPPYTFTVSAGSLPPGITLTGSVVSGTPTTPGSSTFTIQVTDSASDTATQQFTIVITGLAITTSVLPSAAVGTAYSQTLSASGTAPYTWTVTQGTLPGGLTLGASSGTISGTPTAASSSSVTIQVTDSTNATATANFTLTVISASFTGLSSTATSAQQVSFTLALGAANAQAITGQVTLAFQPDASLASPANDPAIQFASGGTSASFTIPANSTAPLGFSIQTGSVAGSITLTVSWSAGGAALPVPAALLQTIQIAPAAPVITAVAAATTTAGFQVTIDGYSNTRDLSKAVLQFTPATGQTLQTTSLTVSLTSAATAWFESTNSDQYGSQFVLTLPFTVTDGSSSSIGSVSVQLVNSQGASSAVSATF